MSYDISFRAKLADADCWVELGDCDANITWNVRDIITQSTGLEWKNEEDNGLVKDVIPLIKKGKQELEDHYSKYLHLESPNGWGTVSGTIAFFRRILKAWERVELYSPELIPALHFWIT